MFRIVVFLLFGMCFFPAVADAQPAKVMELDRQVRELNDKLRIEKQKTEEANREKLRIQAELDGKLKAALLKAASAKQDAANVGAKNRELTTLADGLKRERDGERENARREKTRADNLQNDLDNLRRTAQASKNSRDPGIAIAPGSEQGDPKTGTEKWAYPDAKRVRMTTGGGLEHAVYVTSDDLEKVLKFYGTKLGQKLSGNAPSDGGLVEGGADRQTGSFTDSYQPFDDKTKSYPRRAVAVHIATQNTKAYTVNVVITRVPGESHTHIALTLVSR